MGEVCRARDTRLDRDVAIKILPPQFAADAERVARFEREAHVLAALNHQNIAQIYGIEETAGVSAPPTSPARCGRRDGDPSAKDVAVAPKARSKAVRLA